MEKILWGTDIPKAVTLLVRLYFVRYFRDFPFKKRYLQNGI